MARPVTNGAFASALVQALRECTADKAALRDWATQLKGKDGLE